MSTFFITSSVMILAVLAIRFLCRGKVSFLLLYPLWFLVLIRLLIPFTFFESPVSIMNWSKAVALWEQKQQGSSGNATENTESGDVNLQQYVLSEENGLQADSSDTEGRQKDVATEKQQEGIDKNSRSVLQESEIRSADGEEMQKSLKAFIELYGRKLLILLWGTGSSIFFLVLVTANGFFRREIRRGRKKISIEELTEEGISDKRLTEGRIAVYQTGKVGTPCLFGFIRPSIYLPEWLGIGNKYLKQILEHEIVHFRHRDYIWSACRCLCLCLYWFDPFVWLAAAVSKRDAELACDEAVLRNTAGVQRRAYGEMLLQISRYQRKDALCTAVFFGGEGKHLKERIQMIAKQGGRTWKQVSCILLLALLLVGCGLTSSEKGQKGSAVRNQTADVTTDNQSGEGEQKAEEQAFYEFMQQAVLDRAEWKNWKGEKEDLFFSVQKLDEQTYWLLVAKDVIADSAEATEACVYYYDSEEKKVALLTVISTSGSSSPIAKKDDCLVTESHHAIRRYFWNHDEEEQKLDVEEVSGYFTYAAERKQKEAYSFRKYSWSVPIRRDELQQKLDCSQTISETKLEKEGLLQKQEITPYSARDAETFYQTYNDWRPITFLPNVEEKWEEYLQSGVTSESLTMSTHGNENENVLTMLSLCSGKDFDRAGQADSTIGGIRCTYLGETAEGDEFYFVNCGKHLCSFVVRNKDLYDAYPSDSSMEVDKQSFQKEFASAPVDLFLYGDTRQIPQLCQGDFDKDNEMEVAFVFPADQDNKADYQLLYLFDRNGNGSYEMYSYTRRDFRRALKKAVPEYSAVQSHDITAAYQIEADSGEISAEFGVLRNGQKSTGQQQDKAAYYIRFRADITYQGYGSFVVGDFMEI